MLPSTGEGFYCFPLHFRVQISRVEKAQDYSSNVLEVPLWCKNSLKGEDFEPLVCQFLKHLLPLIPVLLT